MLTTALLFAAAAAVLGGVLGFLSRQTQRQDSPSVLTATLDAALPQLQCGECGYPGCRPYAEAIARDEAPINLCPPGGSDTAAKLAEITNSDLPSMAKAPLLLVAHIRTEECVGCALCLPACPVDAIIGAPRKNHVVLTEECIGCKLCLPPCPVDCIEMVAPPLAEQVAVKSA